MTAPTMLPDLDEATMAGLAPPCDMDDDKCPYTARWVGIGKCCGSVWLICDPHHKDVMELINNGLSWACARCDNRLPPGSPFVSLERI